MVLCPAFSAINTRIDKHCPPNPIIGNDLIRTNNGGHPCSPSPPSFFVLILARELNNSYFNLAQNKLDYTLIGSSL